MPELSWPTDGEDAKPGLLPYGDICGEGNAAGALGVGGETTG